jgi:SnoaL-like domain
MDMDTTDGEHQSLLAKLDRLNALVYARDPAVVDELWSDLGFRLVGSELGEVDETREELAAHMAALFAKPFRVSWAWGQRKVTRQGDIAWVSEIVIAYLQRTERKPYRMFCIFQKVDSDWYWRVFNGSEPVTPYA